MEDSNVMMRDSKTMKAIAAVTAFFLPATTIAVGLLVFLLRQSLNGPKINVLFGCG